MDKVTIYPWPESQLCMGCDHGEFIHTDTYQNSEWFCKIASETSDGLHCKDRVIDGQHVPNAMKVPNET